jgi:two-component system, chemotaxis family, protein-glutamate methylesterase/glutaminase
VPILVLGASTGGTEALVTVLSGLPADTPGTVIVQHMPKAFTGPFAERLNKLSAMDVREAVHGDRLQRGLALLAPGGYQCLLVRGTGGYQVEIIEAPTVNRHRPSVDVLFASTARIAGANTVAAILTGMGDDGAAGMLELRQAGAHTLAQDEATCVVFGMPKEAIRMGGVAAILPITQIAGAITHTFKKLAATTTASTR